MSWREAVRLAVPATLAAVLNHAFRPLDQYFVGGLGKEAQGALGATTFVIILAYAGFLLVSAGAGPLVARATGAGDAEAARRTVGASFFSCAVLSVLLMVSGWVLTEPIVALLRLDGATGAFAEDYLRTIFVTGAGLVFAPMVTSCFNGMGVTSLPLLLQVANVAINAALCPVLIYRLGYGTAGAALASTIGQTAAMLVGGAVLVRRVGLRWTDVRPSAEVLRVARIGSPIAIATAAYALVYWAMLATSISPLGPAVHAGLGIGFGALEAFTWPMYLGGSIALSSMVGRALGAGRPDLAWRAARMMAAPVVAWGVFFAALFYFGAPWLVGAFAADDDALREGILYATVLAFSQPFVAMEAYGEGVLAGAGATRAVFFTTVPFNLLRVPLAYLFAIQLGFGAAGVWWAINLTTYAKAIAKVAMVREGGWARLRI